MSSENFTLRKLQLLGYASQLARGGRWSDARTALRHRKLGYAAMDWKKLIPGPCTRIIDAGAHTGEVAAALDLAFRPRQLLLVEANPALAANLRHRFAAQPHITVAGVALSDCHGSLPFYRHDFDAASSLFALKSGYLASLNLPDAQTVIEVPARRLEEVAQEAGLAEVDLLKLDCQGAELAILRGAGDFLSRIRCVYTEVSFDAIYSGGALFHEIHALLRAAGFALVHLVTSPGAGRNHDQGDALYVRGDVA